MRVIEDAAVQRGKFDMIGINLQMQIGNIIPDIRGRDISLNRMATTSATKKYLQVMGITHNLLRQQTSLSVMPILEAGA
jgi:hypothetical protein